MLFSIFAADFTLRHISHLTVDLVSRTLDLDLNLMSFLVVSTWSLLLTLELDLCDELHGEHVWRCKSAAEQIPG